MRIAVIGAGYVGLVSGTCFSDLGHQVVCVDQDAARIARLQRGEVPIFEPGLEALLASNTAAGRLTFATDLAQSAAGAEVVLIAVGTPARDGDGQADLTSVMAAAAEIGRALTGYAVIVIKSTVPVGTNRKVAEAVRNANPTASFDVVSNPEFLREGAAIDDFMHPDRVVVGVETDRAREVMAALYRPLTLREVPVLYTGFESAELIKYATSAFLATKISFINEIAALCEKVGADVGTVARGMGMDGRIGVKFLQTGPGFGGSCFPKDTSTLVRIGREHSAPQQIVETVIRVNEGIKQRMIAKIVDFCDGDLQGLTIAVFGVTFKPDTDDMRNAQSLTIIPALLQAGAVVRVTDPQGRRDGEALLDGVVWHDDPYGAAKGADLLVLLTEWTEFRDLDLARLARGMVQARMVDLRNAYDRDDLRAAGFSDVVGIGR